jgi:hypothetical protein
VAAGGEVYGGGTVTEDISASRASHVREAMQGPSMKWPPSQAQTFLGESFERRP